MYGRKERSLSKVILIRPENIYSTFLLGQILFQALRIEWWLQRYGLFALSRRHILNYNISKEAQWWKTMIILRATIDGDVIRTETIIIRGLLKEKNAKYK